MKVVKFAVLIVGFVAVMHFWLKFRNLEAIVKVEDRVVPTTAISKLVVRPGASQAVIAPQALAKKPVEAAGVANTELDQLGQQALRSLATRSLLGLEKNQNFHHTPVSLLKSASLLGKFKQRLLEILSQTPENEIEIRRQVLAQGIELYKSCVESDDALTSLRALCYSDWVGLNTMTAHPLKSATLKVPSEVLQLASTLD